MALIEKTYAVVVAVEDYVSLGTGWSLEGVRAQALQFVEWLVNERHLMPDHVQVFATGDVNFGPVQATPPNADTVNNFLAGLGKKWPDGELLLLYWVGHGFISKDGARRLFFGDATRMVKSNLDVNQMIQLLRSEWRGGFNTQIAIIDTCAKFFETLQSAKGLPDGGLPVDPAQKVGVEQYFYFAASSGQYATQGAFGPQVLQILRSAPSDEWPPHPRALRSKIEDLFDQLPVGLANNQQPAWFEYSDGKDNKLVRGEFPTGHEIQKLADRALVPLRYLQKLAEIAAGLPTLATKAGRDALVESLRPPVATKPLPRRKQTQDDTEMDLLSIIAGAIELDLGPQLAQTIVRSELNSNSAHWFEKTIAQAAALRCFWPLLTATRLTIGRARDLFLASHRLRSEEQDPESVEEAVDILIELGTADALVEFLLRSAREHPDDANCLALERWIGGCELWASERTRAIAQLGKEAKLPRYLMVHVEERQGLPRVTRAWLWTSDALIPSDAPALREEGTLASDIAVLQNLAQQRGGRVYIEIMVPDNLMHLDSKQLVWINRGKERNLESLHPVALRWRERMQTPADPSFETGRWYRAAELIEERRRMRAARAEWMRQDCDIDNFSQDFKQDRSGEFIGIEVESEGEGRSQVVALICNGGLPFACWPRRKGIDLVAAKGRVKDMIAQCSFEELPEKKNDFELTDLLLLWDDPSRNPYDPKMSEPNKI